jgi:hypothetical protein
MIPIPTATGDSVMPPKAGQTIAKGVRKVY